VTYFIRPLCSGHYEVRELATSRVIAQCLTQEAANAVLRLLNASSAQHR
jgi:hypothetical protein